MTPCDRDTTQAFCAQFARSLLPALLARIERQRKRMQAGQPVPPEALARTGWCLALLASLSGVDLLRERREFFGPSALVELVLEAHCDAVRSEYSARQGASASPAGLVARVSEAVAARPRGRGFEVALVLADFVRLALVDPGHSPAAALSFESVALQGGCGLVARVPGVVLEPPLARERAAIYDALLKGARLGYPTGGLDLPAARPGEPTAPLELFLPGGWIEREAQRGN